MIKRCNFEEMRYDRNLIVIKDINPYVYAFVGDILKREK